MTKKYNPISCNFYDELELLALRQTQASVTFLDENRKEQKVVGIITNLFAKNKEEFLVLDNELQLRLDQLISINDKFLKNYC